jgi:hypothetical protein
MMMTRMTIIIIIMILMMIMSRILELTSSEVISPS